MSDQSVEKCWDLLQDQANALEGVTIKSLFEKHKGRAEKFSLEAAGLLVDYSKNKITGDALESLLALARARDIEGARKKMLAGEKINRTEGRAVLHVALRDFAARQFHVDGADVSQHVLAVRSKMKRFCEKIISGSHKGFSDQPIDTVVNIGIGGSDLGPLMVVEALKPYWIKGRRAFFVSNVDGQHLQDVLAQVDASRTLFVVASKTFTTQETMTNAQSAKDWFLAQGGTPEDVAKHFTALSTNENAVVDFGIDPENMFEFWDWVGGRYSLWSAIGLSIALQTGFDVFERLLRGAHAMDEHFRAAPLDANMPVLLALIGVWNRNFQNIGVHAILPYDQHLHRMPAYLQQADMESNGKRVTMDGKEVSFGTGPVLFGEPGTNGQHAFYQLIHQGTDIISSDFIAAAKTSEPLGDHHEKLLANFLAQPEALMCGKTEQSVREAMSSAGFSAQEIDAIAPHKVFPGDRPTTSIAMEQLTPETLGALLALYEHKIFCQGIIWGINSFDQWGVELGKVLAKAILPQLGLIGTEMAEVTNHDGSTNMLLNRMNEWRSKGEEA